MLLTVFLTRSALATPDHVTLPENLTEESADWEKTLDEEGVQIFVRDYPGSDYKAFKAIMEIQAPVDSVMAVMAAPNSCVEWVHGCIISYGLDAESFNKRYAYSVNDLPWPVTDRDYVLLISTWNEPDTNRIWMEMHAVKDKKTVNEDYVRVTTANTIYLFEPTDHNTTKMTWLQHTEPGGALPGWLVNALLIDIPFNSLKKLEEVANRDNYKRAKILTDDQGQITGVKPAGVTQ
ncbi:MAG: lipid-binding protein [Proteobacteria bacterium]|nr:MAG: lipid-binding protein [Pseudomonadota bacterium]